MNTATRLAVYTAALAIAFGAAWGVGTAVGSPAPPPRADAHATDPHPTDQHGADSHGAGDGHRHSAGGVVSDGLVATAAGYTLVPQRTTFDPRTPTEFAFTVTGSDGRPVTAFDALHDRRLHLVVVRRDAAGFQHLHPALGPDGVWRVPLELPAAGVYRAYADFVPTGGPALTLGTDLFSPGDFTPVTFPPSRVAQVDGYQVRFDGELVAGAPSQVFATITRDGAPVTDLQPYLGAFGHLVALRSSDLAYLHVHPDGAAPGPADRSGPAVPFIAEVPSAGAYRMFLDFQHDGVVRTAEFTVATAGI